MSEILERLRELNARLNAIESDIKAIKEKRMKQ
jgi:hypothetical protein